MAGAGAAEAPAPVPPALTRTRRPDLPPPTRVMALDPKSYRQLAEAHALARAPTPDEMRALPRGHYYLCDDLPYVRGRVDESATHVVFDCPWCYRSYEMTGSPRPGSKHHTHRHRWSPPEPLVLRKAHCVRINDKQRRRVPQSYGIVVLPPLLPLDDDGT